MTESEDNEFFSADVAEGDSKTTVIPVTTDGPVASIQVEEGEVRRAKEGTFTNEDYRETLAKATEMVLTPAVEAREPFITLSIDRAENRIRVAGLFTTQDAAIMVGSFFQMLQPLTDYLIGPDNDDTPDKGGEA